MTELTSFLNVELFDLAQYFFVNKIITCNRCHLQVCRTSEAVPIQRESPWILCPSAVRKHRLFVRLVAQRTAPPWGNQLQDSRGFGGS